MKKLPIVLTMTMALLVTGCAGVRSGIQTARVTLNKVFDVADKAVSTVENTTSSFTGGTKETVSTATTSQ